MVVERRGGFVGDGEKDGFPVGMRVLAVDDDPVCLKVLEAMLRQCHYHVTTTNQAVKALAMLRENKERFDLVISDVRMPDMDGFKLLELVGLEMDLPVIMMSAYGDTKDVMKGITHGACDYLLKPVRIEELKIIWQHVIRRRKIDTQDKKSFDFGGDQADGFGEAMESVGNSDQIDKQYRKRKDQIFIDDEEGENNMIENEDMSTQKKARVVWSVELHKKFVEAVNQLGVDTEAFPKRILDLMNVEGLTRENVASHLQKYRIYLKKCKAPDPSFMHANPISGYGDYRLLAGPLRLPTTISAFPHSGMIDRPNNSSTLIMDGLMPSISDPSYTRNLNSSIISFGNSLPNETILSRVPLQKNHINSVGEINPLGSSSIFFGACSGVSNSNSTHSLQGNPQETLVSTVHTSKPSARIDSIGGDGLLYQQKINQNWQEGTEASAFKLNSLPISDSFNQESLVIPKNITGRFPLAGSGILNDPTVMTSRSTASFLSAENLKDVRFDEGLLGNVVKNVVSEQTWGKQKEQRTLNGDNNLISSQYVSGRVSGNPTVIGQHGDQVMQRTTGQTNPESYFFQKGDESLEDLMAAMIKREQVEKILMDEEFGNDAYTLGSCV